MPDRKISRKRKKKNRGWIGNICLFIVSVVLLTSLLIRDDTNAYGEGRKAIFKNPINPDYESNDNGVKTSFRVKALNILSGEAEFGSNAMSLVSVSEEDKRRSTVENYADILDLDIYSNLRLVCNVENIADVERNISFEIKMPQKNECTSKINLINSDLDILTGDIAGVDIIYFSNGKAVSEVERKSDNSFDFQTVDSIRVEGSIKPEQKFDFILPVDIVEEVPVKEKTPEEIIEDLKKVDEVNTDTVFDFDIAYRYPITKEMNLSFATCHGGERADDFVNGKIVGVVRKDNNNFDILPANVIESFPNADRASVSMFVSDVEKCDFVNDYSEVKLNISDLQKKVADYGYSLISDNGLLPQSFTFNVGDKIHIYDEYGLELNLGKEDKHGNLLSKVYVEFQNVLKCKDIELTVNGKWDKFDNLESAKIIVNGESKDIDRAKIKVESNVNTKEKGEYAVKYSYEITPDNRISNTAKVKVSEPESDLKESGESISNVRIEHQ